MRSPATALVLALGAAVTAQAQDTDLLPVLIEGTIGAVTAAGADVHLTVFGQTCVLDRKTMVRTPTVRLLLSHVLDPTPLPGRTQPGLVGCSTILEGTVDRLTGTVRAHTMWVEPAENVLIGMVTANAGGQVFVDNTPLRLCTDYRMPARPVRNAFGFEVVLGSVQPGTGIAVEGYYDGAVFRAHTVEVDGPATLTVAAPQLSVERATAREETPNVAQGDEIDVRGAVTMAHAAPGTTTQTVEVWRIDGATATLLGTTTAVRDTLMPMFATWRLRMTTPPTAHPVLGRAPTYLRVVNTSPGANGARADSTVVLQ